MKIALLRHGPTEWNALGRIQGHTDIALSAAGLAKMAALRLPASLAPARVFCSPLTRARQTAAALGLGDPVLDARLMEQNWGQWEGLTRAQILEHHGADAFARAGAAHGEAFRPLGGESTGELHARVAAFLRDAARGAGEMEGDAVAVTHMGVLRAAYTLATGWAMDAPMPPALDVSAILVLTLARSGAPAIAALNLDFIPRKN
jgi:probable phosphoglycerate mutase